MEHELRLRKKAGKTIKVVGVALEMTALATSIMSCSTQKGYYNSTPPLPKKVIPIHFQEYTSKDSILLKERETLSFSKFISESLMILSRIPMNFMVIVSFGSTSIVKFPSMSAAVFFLESLAVMETLT